MTLNGSTKALMQILGGIFIGAGALATGGTVQVTMTSTNGYLDTLPEENISSFAIGMSISLGMTLLGSTLLILQRCISTSPDSQNAVAMTAQNATVITASEDLTSQNPVEPTDNNGKTPSSNHNAYRP